MPGARASGKQAARAEPGAHRSRGGASSACAALAHAHARGILLGHYQEVFEDFEREAEFFCTLGDRRS